MGKPTQLETSTLTESTSDPMLSSMAAKKSKMSKMSIRPQSAPMVLLGRAHRSSGETYRPIDMQVNRDGSFLRLLDGIGETVVIEIELDDDTVDWIDTIEPSEVRARHR